LAQHLQAAGDEAWIVARFTRDRHDLQHYFLAHEESRELEVEGVRTLVLVLNVIRRLMYGTVFRLIWRPWTFPFARLLVKRALMKELLTACSEADIIHFLGSGPEMLGFAAAETARHLKIPFVVEPAMHPGQWGDSWIDRKLYILADKVLAHTEFEASALQAMGVPAGQIKVVVHGVDKAESGSGERFRSKHHIKAEIVLFLGRKTAAKGVYRAIDAFLAIRPQFPQAKLVLMGPATSDFEVPQLEEILNLNDASEKEKQDALAACDLLCVPSEGESFGMVYFEAWAYGKPVVALDLPALRDSLGGSSGGLLVPPGDMQAIGEAICSLLSDPSLREELGGNGRQRYEQQTWENAVDSYRTVFAGLSGKRHETKHMNV
jgi:glycosyltransferase involved in cell wall biosynthesis